MAPPLCCTAAGPPEHHPTFHDGPHVPAEIAVQAFFRRGEGRLVGMQMTPQKLKLLRKAIATLAENRCGTVRHQPLPAASAAPGSRSTMMRCCAFSMPSALCHQLCRSECSFAQSHIACMAAVMSGASPLQGQVFQAGPQRLHHSCESLLLAGCCVSGLLLHWCAVSVRNK